MKSRATNKSQNAETRSGVPKLPEVTQPIGQFREDVPSNFNLKESYLKLFERFGWVNLSIGVILVVWTSIVFETDPTKTPAITYIVAIPFILMETPYNYLNKNRLAFGMDVLCLLFITYTLCI